MKCLIVGGGIGGLTLGVALQRRGIDAEVHEAARELRPVGKGIWVPPNAMQVLARLGLADAVQQAGWPIHRIELVSHGRPLMTIDGAALLATVGFPTVAIHRATLVEILAAALRPGTLSLGRRFQRYEGWSAGVRAYFEGDHPREADLLVGADGLRSSVRGQMRGEMPLRYSGQTCYRGLAALTLPEPLAHACQEFWGGRYRFGYSAVGPGQVYWFAPLTAPAGSAALGIETLRQRYAAFPEPVPSILQATPQSEVIQTDLWDAVPWRDWSVDRVVLLGDAAHPLTPNLGQGAAQAIEDAWVLARRLVERPLELALREYEQLRAPRTSSLNATAWRFGQLSHWENPLACWLRDLALRWTPASVNTAQVLKVYQPPD